MKMPLQILQRVNGKYLLGLTFKLLSLEIKKMYLLCLLGRICGTDNFPLLSQIEFIDLNLHHG